METKESKVFKPINIRQIFKEKNPALAKVIPGFIYKFIDNTLHIDFFNDFISRNYHLEGIEFVNQTITEFNVKEHIFGVENIPEKGRFIFASNHPFGGFDALLLMRNVHKKLGELRFLANDILMSIPGLKAVFVPVNKHGSNSREMAEKLNELYDSDIQIMIFPSGYASRKIKGKVIDLEWKKHFITKAIKHKRDVIPVFVGGQNSNRFYRVANWRKFLGLKWNLEMFYLPDELVKQKNADVYIYFGKPIPWQTFNNSKTHQEWAEWVKQATYQLKENASNTN
ncbi:MAG: 1-acyl-sn-glycerol-3-phosphate acyltransferase [Draconibacterium sp.]